MKGEILGWFGYIRPSIALSEAILVEKLNSDKRVLLGTCLQAAAT